MLILSLPIEGISQEYFNYRYNITGYNLWDYSTSLLQVENGYVLCAETCWPTNSSRRRISLVMLDFEGNQQWIKYFESNLGGYSNGIGYSGCLIKAAPSGFAMIGVARDSYPGWVRDRGILFRLDENYDTLWTQLYGDFIEPCDTELIIRQVHQLDDNGFAIFGGPMDFNDQRPHFSIIRTDSSGNKIWEKFYGEPPFHYYAYHFSVTSDNGFVLGGLLWYVEAQSCDPVLFKTDSNGNEEWFMNLGSEFMDFASFSDITFDDKIIICTIIADSAIGVDDYYGKICFIKLDNGGNIIWQRKYGAIFIRDQLWSIKSLPNGKIVATGSGYRHYPGSGPRPRIGWIICTDSEGDSLWYREYSLLQGEYSKNFLYDIIQTSDSGFIACGYVSPVYPDTGTQDTWVIKVDSIGCESPEYCWTAIEKPEIKPAKTGKLTVFPNPATERITFEMDGEEILAGSLITAYDIYGKLYYEKFLPKSAVSLTIDVSTWSGGIYIARLTYMNNVVGDVKFIVE